MSLDLTEKIAELIRLAKEQGYLTYGDLNDALPDDLVSAEDLDEVYLKLRNLEVEIVDRAPGNKVNGKPRLDIRDD